MRILIVEDEAKTAAYIKKGLTEYGHVVDTFDNGIDGIHAAKEYPYDLMILDLMLPGCDGWTVLKQVRAENKTISILMLTARDSVDDRVKGLSLGADDYLIKPFAFAELHARIEAVTRRYQPVSESSEISINNLTINFSKMKVWRDNQIIHLTSKEFALLALFVNHQSRPLTRTYIAEKVWDINFDTHTNVIDVAVRRLRQKIDKGQTNKLIHTVHGIGYVFEDRQTSEAD